MDADNRRPQLPALSYLDVDKVKREEEAYQSRNTGTPHQGLSSSSTAPSPTYHYPPGPPPPYYSHNHNAPPPPPPPVQHSNVWPASHQAVHTPPESRRTSEHEKEGTKQNTRQLLPSISEALGVDSQTSFAPSSAPPLPLQPALLPQPPAIAPASPSPTLRRSYPMEPPPGPPATFPSSGTFSQYSQYRSEQQQQQPPPPPSSYPTSSDATRTPAAYPSAPDSKPPLHIQPSQPQSRQTPSTPCTRPPVLSPTYESRAPQTTGSMGPPGSFHYGYSPYPPRYAGTSTATNTSTGPIYQPSTVYGAPQTTSSSWKPENASRYDDRHSSQANYGDNVKRHLDFYDFETSLNEIANTSSILSDFSRRYGDRMHATQRTGATLSTLPSIVEVDDMISKSRVQLDCLGKIREVVLAQQAAYEQQVADQPTQHKGFAEAASTQPDASTQETDESKSGGFAGTDTKKRRGRAAPPGRCHSCNRAETPEWRRGPDGARTLCNACGLHYAKLTRKNNGANKPTNGGSNLSPKESLPQ